MNPLAEIKKMVKTPTQIRHGEIVKIGASGITVRGRDGLKSFSSPNPQGFKVGDTVRFQGNVLLGKAIGSKGLPVYQV